MACEAEIGRDTRDADRLGGQRLEREPLPELDPVAVHRHAGEPAKHAAEMKRRDAESLRGGGKRGALARMGDDVRAGPFHEVELGVQGLVNYDLFYTRAESATRP